MSTVSYQIPSTSLDTIQSWIPKSRLDRKLFYSTALELGMRTMETSLSYLDDLTSEAMAETAQLLGDNELLSDDSRSEDTLSEEILTQYGRTANKSITP